MGKKESVERRDLSGKVTHTDHFEDGKLVGRSVDRTNLLDSNYNHTDNYGKNWNKTGTSKKD